MTNKLYTRQEVEKLLHMACKRGQLEAFDYLRQQNIIIRQDLQERELTAENFISQSLLDVMLAKKEEDE